MISITRSLIALLFLFYTVRMCLGQSSECTPSINTFYSKSDNTCVVVIDKIQGRIIYQDFVTKCGQYGPGYSLPTTKTVQKRDEMAAFLTAYANQTFPSTWIYVMFWMNIKRDTLTDIELAADLDIWRQKDAWRWQDDRSSLTEEIWDTWFADEPNNHAQDDESCVTASVLSRDKKMRWNDARCTPIIYWYRAGTQFPIVVCEKKLGVVYTTTSATGTTAQIGPSSSTTGAQQSTNKSCSNSAASNSNNHENGSTGPGVGLLIFLYIVGFIFAGAGLYAFMIYRRRQRGSTGRWW